MTSNDIKILEERVQACEKKLEKMQNLEERLEKAFRNVEKYRDKMIQSGYSYQMLQEFNAAVQPITQHCNEIRNARKKIQLANDLVDRLEQEETERAQKRKQALMERIVLKPAEFPYNHKCRNFSFTDGEALCEIKMDLQYCGKNCPFATTEPCSTTVDSKGNAVFRKKRRLL